MGPLDIGDNMGPCDMGDIMSPLDMGDNMGPLDIGDNMGPLDIGGNTGPLDMGGSMGPLDIGDNMCPLPVLGYCLGQKGWVFAKIVMTYVTIVAAGHSWHGRAGGGKENCAGSEAKEYLGIDHERPAARLGDNDAILK